ncbi:MAG: amino acid ABC transporter substrate-binding protein [Gemmatimonadetes bacterium]|nr:amino acid ABC transporter substrate-binding protein [Gemmatimonadota bacterium]MXY83247.1 amino acid ABC transporter substrate-binding protein [Gemmatimonadota bacterium]MYB70307.1 amino acid ABC transporter substrate-binding protein [Gemmatimonadota bacterium]
MTPSFSYASFAASALFSMACSSSPSDSPSAACGDGQVLQVGFYAFFAPVSHSANPEPGTAGFDEHLGYEADLLTGLEIMDGAGLSFARRGIAVWDDIWLQSTGPEYDLVGGGITILDSRTRNAAGEHVVNFTSGHITFRQSLLVRAEDAEHFASHSDLTSEDRVGVLRGTTGEFRLLELTGFVDAQGALVAGTRIETAEGELLADGTAAYTITAAGASDHLAGRTRLVPPTADMPQVIYLGQEAGEVELLEALENGTIDAIARGEIGNRDASVSSDGEFVVAALDTATEWGGFALAVEDADLAACIDDKINYLTDSRRIGYGEWRANPAIFAERAQQWNP